MGRRDAYATPGEYRARVEKAEDIEDDDIRGDLLGITRLINLRLNRPLGFGRDDEAVARILMPTETGRSLLVPPIAMAEDFEILTDTLFSGSFAGLTAWLTGDYQLRPLNAELDAEPFNEIFVPSWSTKTGFVRDQPTQITAVWGWPEVPPAIKIACIELTGILRLETPRATGQVNFGPEQVESISKRARDILDELMDPYAGLPVVG